MAQIRALYRKYSDQAGASQVNLQGIVFNTNDGGRLPVEQYVAATFNVRAQLQHGSDVKTAIAMVAKNNRLNAKYLGILWDTLSDREPSLLLDEIRAHWRTATAADAPRIAAEIGQWQKALWRFASVGHIGKVGGPKAWQEPIDPIASAQELRIKVPAPTKGQKDITLYLVASDGGDGNAGDFVIWQRPRLVAPGRPDLLMCDVDDFTREMSARRERTFASTAKALAAAAEAGLATGKSILQHSRKRTLSMSIRSLPGSITWGLVRVRQSSSITSRPR